MKWLNRRLVIIIILLFVGAGVIYIRDQKSPTTIQKSEKSYTATRSDLKETLTLSGSVDATEKVTLSFQTPGVLAWVGVKVGDTVNAYQAIASLDQREVQKNLEIALRNYSKQRNDFEETWRVTYKGVSNPDTALTDTIKRILQKNQWDLEKAVLDVELKDLAVQYATLITPIAGIVTHMDTPYAGVNVTPTAQFEVINPKTVYLSVTADQTEVTKLQTGMPTEVTFDSYPAEHLIGEISSISFTPKSGETGTVYEVKIALPINNDTYKYRMNMSADSVFTLNQKQNVLAVPTNFIKSDKDKKFLWVKKGNKKEKVFITTGIEMDDMTEITWGIKEGDVVYD